MGRLRHVSLTVPLLVCILAAVSASTPTGWAQNSNENQRPRRQFDGNEWVPLSQPCPTCRHITDPNDARGSRTNFDDIGLVPPRPPPASRQVQGTANFFPQSSGLQQNLFGHQRQRFPDFSFGQFAQQQPFFSQQQQQSFHPQTYLNNPQLLLNENPQLFPLVNNPQFIPQPKPQLQQLTHPQNNIGNDNQIRFRPESQKLDLKPPQPPQNIRLEQDNNGPLSVPVPRLELPRVAPPTPFHSGLASFPLQQQQHQQQQHFSHFPQQQSLLQVNNRDPFLHAPAPAPVPSALPVAPTVNNSDIVIPGLDKEEIQLLYVPVETLRQRGQLQGHTLEDQKPAFLSQQFSQFQQGPQTPTGHFITQPPLTSPSQSPSPLSLLSSVTPPAELTQSLPLHEQTQHFSTATASPSVLSTTEQVVTIQPRPVSTVGQSTSSSKFTGSQSSPFTQGKDISSNEVTPSFSTTGSGVSRYTDRPSFEAVTENAVPTTTLQPHQPPLSIYVSSSSQQGGEAVDVLQQLKESSSVAVIDNFSYDSPQVFVGPGNLNPPTSYSRFDLPYLSNLEPSRIEHKDNLPFFVAPLNFNPPQGYSKIPFPAPHVGAVVYLNEDEAQKEDALDLEKNREPKVTTEATTTTIRSRGRRPSTYRQGTRRPVSSRQRVTSRPQEQEVEVTQEISREPQSERKRQPSRRQRVRTTTEAVTAAGAHSSLVEETIEPQGVPVELNAKLMDFDTTQVPQIHLQQPVHPPAKFQSDIPQMAALQAQYPQDDFVPPPPPTTFDKRRPIPSQSQLTDPLPILQQLPFAEQPKFEMFHPTPEEIQGMFDLPPPTPQLQPGFYAPTANPAQINTASILNESTYNAGVPEEEKVDPTPENESSLESLDHNVKDVEQLDIGKTKSRFTYPSAPGIKSPSDSSHTRSETRARLRDNTTTTLKPSDNNDDVVGEYVENVTTQPKETTRTTSKYLSHFNRSRKPHRATSAKPEVTTSSTPTRSYTIRPLRRTTARTSVSTKRIRKPTTPLPNVEDDAANDDDQLHNDHKFAPSATSNEIYDERTASSPHPKPRKPFFQKKKYTENILTSTSSPSTKTYQERRDEFIDTEEKAYETNAAIGSAVAASTAEHVDAESEKEKGLHSPVDDTTHDSEQSKKARRRLRVKVQRRPQDNFETAESQNHGSVSNLLVPPSAGNKPTAPDLYRFGKGEYDFADSDKFIATHHKDYVRNITVDILENTDSFSSPGSDTTVSQVTIVSEQTTVIPETPATSAALISNHSVKQSNGTFSSSEKVIISNTVTERDEVIASQGETTVSAVPNKNSTPDFIQEETTENNLETTTVSDDESPTTISVNNTPTVHTTTPEQPSQPPQVRNRKVLKTSTKTTTTQVSHETEICYKGKCIKTNSDNPDKALKRLVEQANAGLTKVKT